MFIPSTFKRPVSSWKALNLRKTLLDRKSGSAGMPRPKSYAVFCLKKKSSAALALFALSLGTVAAQPTADQQAEMLLNVGRKAYADANPQCAAEKFREFLTKFGANHD